ncbi:hypothetical protein GN156_07455 [bacterium LRH843]|nr:hypothetical protein [bacterium LRH843]
MKNLVLEKFNQNKKSVGTFLHSGSSIMVESLGYTDIDYVVIDMEHTPIDTGEIEKLIVTARVSETAPFVRVSDSSRGPILKLLDAGAEGIIVPNIETVEQVHKLVEYAKYSPVGNRGFAPGRAAGWGNAPSFSGGIESYMEICNRETLLIPQCETVGCLENIEAIVAIDGVDGIMIGPFDLSIAMGKPAQFDDLEIKGAIDKVLNACKAASKMCIIFAGNPESASHYLAKGFDSVIVGTDNTVLIKAYQDLLSNILIEQVVDQ